MLQKIIPSSGENIPVIGLGTWIKFDVSSTPEKENLLNSLKLFSGRGKVIDTSPMYGNAEKILGTLTQQSGYADVFFMQQKCGQPAKKQALSK